MYKLYFIIILDILSFNIVAQSNEVIKAMPVSCDCEKPINIALSKFTTYGITVPPSGFGSKKDINQTFKNSMYFDEEHHTAWYILTMPFDGNFIFEIIPEKIEDDYDFMLFKYSDVSFCNQIKNKTLTPERSNIARNKKEIKSITGLSVNATQNHVAMGIGASHSKYLAVKKGEKYILVLDNVYANGKGHTIEFSYKNAVEISGIVKGDDAEFIKAEITLEDRKGNEIVKTESDEKTGKWQLKDVYLTEGLNYTITIYNDSTFTQSKTINTNKNENLVNIITVLPKLKGGKKYVLSNINFYGNQDVLIPSSVASVHALYKLMQKNKNMVIRIEGHTNGCTGDANFGSGFSQKLSDLRAKAIANSLVEKGINAERISSIGFNCQYMLYPKPKNEFESEQNRRVEINIISLE